MAKLLAPKRTRGRKPGALKLGTMDLIASLKAPGEDMEYAVEVAPKIGRAKRGEILTFEAPKNAVLIPLSLTEGKSEGNARQTIQNAAKSVGVNVAVGSVAFEYETGPNKGTESVQFYVTKKS